MRFRIVIVSAFSILFSCKAKDSSSEGLKSDLKTTMQNYLYKQINNDSTNIKYNVEDVIYYEDVDKYICEFKVHLKEKLFDTTGTMKANVSKDLQTVTRIY